MSTSLQILQNVAAGLGVSIPNSFYGNTEATARRLLRAYIHAGAHLRSRDWRALTFEHTFATVSGTLEYALPTSPAFHHLKPATAFDRTNYRGQLGPINPADWQYGEAVLTVSGGIDRRFRIKTDSSATPHADKFYLLDDPAGAYTLAYEYVTNEWLYDGSSAYSATYSADTQQPVFDDYLIEMETTWRALRALGEQYFDEKDEAGRIQDRFYAQENGALVSMAARRQTYGFNVPEGNWA